MVRAARMILLILLLTTTFSTVTTAQTSPLPSPPPTTAPSFDVNAAVEAYLAKVPAERRARSNAYFEGGYWLILWDFLVTIIVMWLLLALRWSARMRDLAERITRMRALQTALYWVQFFVVTSVLSFPMTLYESYFREHQYALLNQTFGPWMQDQLVMLAVNLVLGAFLLMALFAVVRRLGKKLVGLGSGRGHGLPRFRQHDCARLHISFVQQIHETAGCANQRSDSEHGSRQRHSRHRSL